MHECTLTGRGRHPSATVLRILAMSKSPSDTAAGERRTPRPKAARAGIVCALIGVASCHLPESDVPAETAPLVPFVETATLRPDALASASERAVARERVGDHERLVLSPTDAVDGECVAEFAPWTPRLPFRDAIVSWNVHAPAGTGARFELSVSLAEGAGAERVRGDEHGAEGVRPNEHGAEGVRANEHGAEGVRGGEHGAEGVRVGEHGADSWSPWMVVGDVGLVPTPAPDPAWSGGRVDTDYFAGRRACARARVRVRAFSAKDVDARSKVVVERVTVCVSDRTVAVEDVTPRVDPALVQRRLDVPFRSQRTEDPAIAGRICSPTSLAMVLAYRGVDRAVGDVAARVFDARHDLYGNWPRNVQAAYEYGVPGYVTRIASWREAEARIARGTPLIASIGVRPGQLAGAPYESTSGHLIVITGFDEHGDVHVNDPAASDEARGRVVYRRADLQTVWLDRGGTCYVLDSP